MSNPLKLLARIVKSEKRLKKEFSDSPTISDQSNDLTYQFLEPKHPSVITFDPNDVSSRFAQEELESGVVLSRIIKHYGALMTAAPDFPFTTIVRSVNVGGDFYLAHLDSYQLDETRLSKSKVQDR